MHRDPYFAALICASILTGCADQQESVKLPQPIESPSALHSSEPHLAVSPQGDAVLSWIEPAGDDAQTLQFSVLGPDGWSAPQTVATGSDWFLNWADFPSVEPIRGDLWAAHWLVRQAAGGHLAYDVALSWSHDGGATWSAPVTPHTDRSPIDHGFVSLFPWGDDIGAIWLDGRNVSLEETDEPGHATAHGDMMLQSTTVAANGTPGAEVPVDDTACDCCQTDVAVGARGPIVAYRDRAPGEIRDIYASVLENNRWSAPIPVGGDGWHIPGCPVNGPAIAAQGNDVVVAWFTAANDSRQIRLARSRNGGQSFEAPIVVAADNVIGRVDVVLLPDQTAIVSYIAATRDKDAQIRIRQVQPDDQVMDYQLVAETSSARLSGFPQMVLTGEALIFAWTEPSEPTQVRTAKMALN